MYTDYKIVEEREENGIFYQKVRYYSGDITTENEYNAATLQVEPVTRYRRTTLADEVEYSYEAV